MRKFYLYIALSCYLGSTTNLNAQCWSSANAGLTHSIGIKTDSTLWVWGSSNDLKFDSISNYVAHTPTKVAPTKWKRITTRFASVFGIQDNGSLWAWGSNAYGNLGDSTIINRGTFKQIGTEQNWNMIASSLSTTYALKQNGSLWGWGSNAPHTYPTQIHTDTDWVYIGSGFSSEWLALKSDSTLWAWGYNGEGQLGNGTTTRVSGNPVQIGAKWLKLSVGYNHSLAIASDGTLWAWGKNNQGQLGDGTTVNSNIPVKIDTNRHWKSISAGKTTSFAIANDGTLWAWGENNYGQLGIGTNSSQNKPVKVGTSTNWASVSAGEFHTLGTQTDGTLWAWGSNDYRRLGDQSWTTSHSTIPKQVLCSTTDIESIEPTSALIYPNPSVDGNFTIQFNQDAPSSISVTIYNVLGQTVYQNTVTTTTNLEIKEKGLLWVKIQSANHTLQLHKVIVP